MVRKDWCSAHTDRVQGIKMPFSCGRGIGSVVFEEMLDARDGVDGMPDVVLTEVPGGPACILQCP